MLVLIVYKQTTKKSSTLFQPYCLPQILLSIVTFRKYPNEYLYSTLEEQVQYHFIPTQEASPA